MPGRKPRKLTDSERKREYRVFQKRAAGEVSPQSGVPAEIEHEREEWYKAHEARGSKKS